MSTNSSRNVLRAFVLSAITALVAASFALLASPAEAAWSTNTTVHDAKLQLCKVKRDGGWKIKVRVDNRRAPHGHYGTLFRTRGGHEKSVRVWAKRGKISRIESLQWKRGDSLGTMISERSGVGAGGGAPIGSIPRC